jgi:ribulose 1,5-bisphosphate carboxylase large subunit-like protein
MIALVVEGLLGLTRSIVAFGAAKSSLECLICGVDFTKDDPNSHTLEEIHQPFVYAQAKKTSLCMTL